MSYLTADDESSVDKTASLKAMNTPGFLFIRTGGVAQQKVRDLRSIDPAPRVSACNHAPDQVRVKLPLQLSHSGIRGGRPHDSTSRYLDIDCCFFALSWKASGPSEVQQSSMEISVGAYGTKDNYLNKTGNVREM